VLNAKRTCTYIRSDSTISYRLKSLGMIQKQGNWVPYELKPRNVERRFFTYEMLLARHKRKGFLHRIVTGDKKWIHYDNPKKRKSWGPGHLAMLQHRQPSRIFMEKNSCCVCGRISLVSCIMNCSNETITGALYRT